MIFAMFTNTTFAISNNLNDLGIKYLVKSEPEETDIRTESLAEVSVTTEASVKTEVSVTTPNNIFFRSAKNENIFKYDPNIDTEYTVIVIDMSSSMVFFTDEISNQYIRSTAKKIAKLKYAFPCNENIAIIAFGDKIITRTNFTNDLQIIENSIPTVNRSIDKYDYHTNLNMALEEANNLLSSTPNSKRTNIRKNVIILSDGLPNSTNKEVGSKYDNYSNNKQYHPYGEVEYYFTVEAANAAYETAKNMKEQGYKIATVSFVGTGGTFLRDFTIQFLKDLQNYGYYTDEYILKMYVPKFNKTNLSGTFRFPSTSKNKDFEERFYYDDSYFERPSQEYNPILSTMSLCLALSAFASSDEKDYANKSKNAKELLTKIGFRNFKQNDKYEKKPTTDSIGAVIANKKLITKNGTSYTLIALAIRGGGYESEWAGNFTLGTTEMHAGFLNAKRQVLDFLKKYIKENNITGNIKLWIVGYSRAAATANLLAGSINDGESIGNSKKMHLSHDDIYVYTFETPQGAILNGKTQTEEQKNIHNIINVDDPVPYVAPECWKYTRYGEDYKLPEFNNIDYDYKLSKMKDKLSKIKAFKDNSYKIDKFYKKKYKYPVGSLENGFVTTTIDDENTKYSQGPFLRKTINDVILKYIQTKDNYRKNYQPGIRDFIRYLYEQKAKNPNYSVFKAGIGALLFKDFNRKKYIYFTDAQIDEYIQNCINKNDPYIYKNDKIKKAVRNVFFIGWDLGNNDWLTLETLWQGSDSIAQGHYPEICLAWLQSEDPKYSYNDIVASTRFNSFMTRTVRINCPVDVEIYDKNNQLIGSIINDKKILATGYKFFGLNEDGEKQADLPLNGSYTIKITARDKGTVSYGVVEDHPYKGTAKILNFDNIAIEKGTVLKAYAPEFSREDLDNNDGLPSSTHYTLFNETKNKEILPTSEYLMDDAKNFETLIEVEPEDRRIGMTSGNGYRITNAPAKVYAIPAKGYRLEGWYENGVKVSEDYEYKTKADKYRKLTAKFITFEEYKKKVEQEKKTKTHHLQAVEIVKTKIVINQKIPSHKKIQMISQI